MNIGLDMMGGDFAPLEAVKSIQPYISGTKSPANLFLIGDEAIISPHLDQLPLSRKGLTVVHASQVIGMHEHPTRALKEKQQSSIAVGFQMLASDKIDAFISAGNTGAMLVGAHYSIRTLPGVIRPTISSILPKENGKAGLILDVGLNADCKPEHLNQFAMLGSVYSRYILGTDQPRVALINIGEEEGKGNLLAQAAYPLLKMNDQINFIGNVEGRDVFLDKADVMVCDGFTGNVVLKMAESIYDITNQKGIKHEFLERFNFENYGGTPILGVSKPVIIGHGISHATAFTNMIMLAHRMLEMNLIGHMKDQFLSL